MQMTKGERLLEAVRGQMDATGTPDAPEMTRVRVRGVPYLIRSMTAERLAALYQWRRANRSDTPGLYARLVVFSLVDARGEYLLSAAEMSAVQTWPPVTLEALAGAIVKHNHMG